MFDDTIDGDGNVHLRALKGANGRGGDFCIELRSGYGMITTDFIPNEVCDFRNARYGNFERDVDDTFEHNAGATTSSVRMLIPTLDLRPQ